MIAAFTFATARHPTVGRARMCKGRKSCITGMLAPDVVVFFVGDSDKFHTYYSRTVTKTKTQTRPRI